MMTNDLLYQPLFWALFVVPIAVLFVLAIVALLTEESDD